MRRPLVEETRLRLKVPRGHDGIWSIIQDLAKTGEPITRVAIDRRSNVAGQTIGDYLQRLVKAGYLAIERTEPRGGARREHVYRLARPAREAPRLRRDGTELPEPATTRMWRAMKMLDRWTIRELAAATAIFDEPAAPMTTVQTYVLRLVAAGVVQTLVAGRGPVPATFRLARNLGGAAPRILRCHAVFDPNAGAVVGDAIEAEVLP